MITKLNRTMDELSPEEYAKRITRIFELMSTFVPLSMQTYAWNAINDGVANGHDVCVHNLIELINIEDNKKRPDPNLR